MKMYLKSNTIPLDGSDSILHIIVVIYSGVNIHHFKVYWGSDVSKTKKYI